VEKLAITLEAFTYVIISLICLILLVVVIAIGFSLSFYNQISQFFGMLFYVMQLASGIILIAGTSAVLWFGSDRILSLLIRIEKYQQERAETAQERAKVAQAQAKIAQEQAKAAQAWARIEVIQSEAAINRAKAISSEIRIEQINRNRGALVVRGSDMKLIEPFRDAPEAAAPQLMLPQTTDPLPLLLDSLHLLVIGFTGGGKTTLLHHLATQWSQSQRVMVLDLDYAHGMWPGAEIYTDDNVADFCRMLADEFARRKQLRQSGQQTRFDPWRIVIDEYSAVAENKTVRSIVELLIRRGRKYFLCVDLGIQDKQVKSMGWEGKGALRDNFTYIVEAKRATSGQRTLTLTPNDGDSTIYMTPNLPDPESSVRPSTSDAKSETEPSRTVPSHLASRYSKLEKAIAARIIKGWSKTKTRQDKKVVGSNQKISELYDRIKAELQAAEAEAEQLQKQKQKQKQKSVFVKHVIGLPKTNGEVLH